MKISAIALQEEVDGLKKFEVPLLQDLVLLTGCNGAGKTRLLKAIQRYVEFLQLGVSGQDPPEKFTLTIQDDQKSETLSSQNADAIQIVNYSHYDAKLQMPGDFSPYVIHKAKEILKRCDYEETALNSLLFIEDMAKGYSAEYEDGSCFARFQKDAEENFEIKIHYDRESKKLKIFGQDIDRADLSPGQQYLLRMAVACFQNENEDKLIFFMDEPELHLHPKALIRLLENIRKKFPTSQLWISTHSLALVSYFSVIEENATILYLRDGQTERFRSNSGSLLDGLIGSEENRFAMQQLMETPDAYASNRFTFECFDSPAALPGKDGTDEQVAMIGPLLCPGDVIVDYGAGKGRFWEELALGDARTADGTRAVEAVTYYAYNKKEVEKEKDARDCKAVMREYGSTEKNYFNDFELLREKTAGRANYVLFVNVLHEIPPSGWPEVFKNAISLLNEGGKIIIVEREELMIGEAPYEQGFLMITSNAVKALFGETKAEEMRHQPKDYLVRYQITPDAPNLGNMVAIVRIIRQDAFEKIRQLKEKPVSADRYKRFKNGISLAFWLHQYANAALLLEQEAVID